MQTIQQQIASGRKYLVIELLEGTAKLMTRDEVFVRPGGPGPMQMALVDIEEILERFDGKAPQRDVFTLTEVATMAKQKGPTVHAWIKAGILTPSIRDRNGTSGRAMLFSRHDAFVACLVASLKRTCGLPLSKLGCVSEALRPHDGAEQGGSRLKKTNSQPQTKQKRGRKVAKGVKK